MQPRSHARALHLLLFRSGAPRSIVSDGRHIPQGHFHIMQSRNILHRLSSYSQTQNRFRDRSVSHRHDMQQQQSHFDLWSDCRPLHYNDRLPCCTSFLFFRQAREVKEGTSLRNSRGKAEPFLVERSRRGKAFPCGVEGQSPHARTNTPCSFAVWCVSAPLTGCYTQYSTKHAIRQPCTHIFT